MQIHIHLALPFVTCSAQTVPFVFDVKAVHSEPINNTCARLLPGSRMFSASVSCQGESVPSAIRAASITEVSGALKKNGYKLVNLEALTFSLLSKLQTFQCMGKIFCVEFQRVRGTFEIPRIYLAHTLKDASFIQS